MLRQAQFYRQVIGRITQILVMNFDPIAPGMHRPRFLGPETRHLNCILALPRTAQTEEDKIAYFARIKEVSS